MSRNPAEEAAASVASRDACDVEKMEHMELEDVELRDQGNAVDSSAESASTDIPSICAPNDNGAIFAYLVLPILLAGVIHYAIHLVVFAKEKAWAVISTVYLVIDDAKEERNIVGADLVMLSVHAFLAIATVYTTLYQVLSGLSLTLSTRKAETCTRNTHRRMGRPVALLWAVSVLTGLIYAYASPDAFGSHKDDKDESLVFFLGITQFASVAMMVNLYNGVRAVSGNKKDRDYILHKGSMYFVVYWIGFSWSAQLAMQVLQATVFSDCDLGKGPLLIYSFTVICSVEYLVYMAIGLRWGGSSYRRPFVRYNLIVMGIELVFFWVGTTYIIILDPYKPHAGEGCFAEGLL